MRLEDKLLISHLANTAKLTNTINGGMAEPIAMMDRTEDAIVMTLKLPSVDVENIRIEVKNGFLFVFQNLQHEDEEIELPYLIKAMDLKNQIDLDAIYAEFEEGEIFIHLPFNEMADGFEREIDIIKK